ncbi:MULTISPECIES: aldehyde dehydrogenase family protein [unclassified Mucilaginibacter]|uniref:aldehyde dehydrogenase family protein n=1 Tax=unclassified Mucilaginibacter TaxID=2617802 RepID=UPI002AC97450|nr:MULTISPECIES: aldehyde dehydrogenase family protein [unclassified Mucilaginibacter]MEB0249166.1 aldehyde dehydrogenase family protein [Mucilaginibacter sp. 5B2]MEB0264023.1 aldehyde dehydrogenase family protein [Mucilaginibacter sp. 10I4]MEB0277612.1 aldehyde dehydrogenase family protein [Mucilaginibacter sp. 10B2]MEB0299527.1 aldehyde dehydrogenase family protein [Mucilaginibacter sp. 5C4]WPX24760.1 aldehyde dehydrogenase family protein [Mucilaginibacter sp. 5C4]
MSINKKPSFKDKYDNFIGGKFVAPVKGEYFDNVSPIDGKVFTKAARSTKEDVELALDAAHAAFESWGKTSAATRAGLLNKIADTIEANLDYLATVEAIDNGKAIRETKNADLPLVIDHFRYFAGVIRAEEGGISEHDEFTVSIVLSEPLGVVGQIIPWNFPLLMATWKIAPALAAGNCCVVKPAEQTPTSIMVLMELIGDILPAGVLNIVTGFGPEAGKPLASSPRIAKVSFTGETTTGRLIMQYASENLIPVTMELGGKSPNIFFESVADADDAFFDKAIEGAVMFALNQGEVCTCPSRILIQESIYDKFIARVIERVNAIKMGNPLDDSTMMGAQASNDQYEKIQSYLKIGREEGAEVLCGGEVKKLDGELGGGYYIQPTLFKGHNKMRIFQEEIFGPVACVTTFKTVEEAIEIANDTLYGLGAGVWTRDAHEVYQVPRAIQAGRVWVNNYHAYPAHAPFGGYKKSGFGRENHKMMLGHYRQTKNMLISYNKNKLGFF